SVSNCIITQTPLFSSRQTSRGANSSALLQDRHPIFVAVILAYLQIRRNGIQGKTPLLASHEVYWHQRSERHWETSSEPSSIGGSLRAIFTKRSSCSLGCWMKSL